MVEHLSRMDWALGSILSTTRKIKGKDNTFAQSHSTEIARRGSSLNGS